MLRSMLICACLLGAGTIAAEPAQAAKGVGAAVVRRPGFVNRGFGFNRGLFGFNRLNNFGYGFNNFGYGAGFVGYQQPIVLAAPCATTFAAPVAVGGCFGTGYGMGVGGCGTGFAAGYGAGVGGCGAAFGAGYGGLGFGGFGFPFRNRFINGRLGFGRFGF